MFTLILFIFVGKKLSLIWVKELGRKLLRKECNEIRAAKKCKVAHPIIHHQSREMKESVKMDIPCLSPKCLKDTQVFA